MPNFAGGLSFGCNQWQLAFAALKAAENMVERVKRHSVSADWEEAKGAALGTLGISVDDYQDLEDDFFELL